MASLTVFVLVSICLWGLATATISVEMSSAIDITASSSDMTDSSSSDMGIGGTSTTDATQMTSTPTQAATSTPTLAPSSSETAMSASSTTNSVLSTSTGATSIHPTPSSVSPRPTPTKAFEAWKGECDKICCPGGLAKKGFYNLTRECKQMPATNCRADIDGHNTTKLADCPVCKDNKCLMSSGVMLQSIFLATLLMSALVFALL